MQFARGKLGGFSQDPPAGNGSEGTAPCTLPAARGWINPVSLTGTNNWSITRLSSMAFDNVLKNVHEDRDIFCFAGCFCWKFHFKSTIDCVGSSLFGSHSVDWNCKHECIGDVDLHKVPSGFHCCTFLSYISLVGSWTLGQKRHNSLVFGFTFLAWSTLCFSISPKLSSFFGKMSRTKFCWSIPYCLDKFLERTQKDSFGWSSCEVLLSSKFLVQKHLLASCCTPNISFLFSFKARVKMTVKTVVLRSISTYNGTKNASSSVLFKHYIICATGLRTWMWERLFQIERRSVLSTWIHWLTSRMLICVNI